MKPDTLTDRARQIALVFIIPILLNIAVPYSVDDLAGWIAHGIYFLNHGKILRSDIFSVLPTSPLIYCSWGISVLYAVIYKIGGLLSVCLLHTALFALILWIIYKNSIFQLKNFDSLRNRFLLYAFWLASIPAIGARPSLVALIPLLIGYLEISRIKGTISPLGILKLALLNIVWVNIHGSFILLPLMMIWKTVWDWKNFRLSRVVAILTILISTWMNPFHFSVFPYVLQTFEISRHRITEWNSLAQVAKAAIASQASEILFAVLVIGSIYWLWKKRKTDLGQLVSSPYFLLLLTGFFAIRNTPLAFFVLLPFCFQQGLLQESSEPLSESLLNWGKVLVAFVLLMMASPLFHKHFDETATPEIAQAIREAHTSCPVFNDWELGSYFILEIPNRIFLDWRNVIYSDSEIAEYRQAIQAQPGWEAYLEKYHVCMAALKAPEDQALMDAMARSPLWRAVTREKSVVLFERRI